MRSERENRYRAGQRRRGRLAARFRRALAEAIVSAEAWSGVRAGQRRRGRLAARFRRALAEAIVSAEA